MSRGQQQQVFDTSNVENKAYNTNAQGAFGTAQQDINSYGAQVGKFNAANPYVAGGQFQTAENQQLSDTAAGQAQRAGQAVQGAAVRTGQNAGGAIAATKDMQNENERALAGQEAGATQQRIGAGTGYAAEGLGMLGTQQQMQERQAAGQGALAQGALGTEEQAAQTPSYGDMWGGEVIQSVEDWNKAFAQAYAGGGCPAKGALYLMSDGFDRRVEDLRVDDLIMGIDEEPQLIEEIVSSYSPTVWVTTENGLKTRNSWTHAFALPKGGFTVAAKALGKIIATALGPSKIVAVEDAGTALVFNVITDGSHTYRADGIWAYGVGDAERHISMKEWCKIGERLAVSRG